MTSLSDERKLELLNQPSYNFLQAPFDIVNDHDNTIVRIIEETPLLKDRVFWWNKRGRTLIFKLLVEMNDTEIREVIKKLEKTHKLQFREVVS